MRHVLPRDADFELFHVPQIWKEQLVLSAFYGDPNLLPPAKRQHLGSCKPTQTQVLTARFPLTYTMQHTLDQRRIEARESSHF